MAQDSDLQQLAYTIQFLEDQANLLNDKQHFLLETLQGLQITKETINQLENLPENHEIILPIGNRAFLKARVQDPSKILVAIGKDVILEKPLPEARDYTQIMIDNIKQAQKQTQDSLNEVVQKLDELKNDLNMRTQGASEGQSI